MKLTDISSYLEKKDSLSLLLLPFFILFVKNEGHVYESICFFSLILIFEIIILEINLFLRFLIYLFTIITFYTLIFYDDTQDILHSGKTVLFFLIGFSLFIIPLTILIFTLKKFKQINLFLFLFSILLITTEYFFSFNNSNEDFLDNIGYNYKNKDFGVEKKSSPVILIILDELVSYNDLFNVTNDSLNSFNFSRNLKKNGYLVNNEFVSETRSTIYSIPSIFNFNLFDNSTGMDSIDKIGRGIKSNQMKFRNLIKENKLINNLNNKGVKSHSFGYTEFNETSNIDHIWGINKNFKFSLTKTFFLISSKTLLNKIPIFGIYPRFFKIDSYNRQVYRNLKKIEFKDNNFYYFQFYAPHKPFIWGSEFKFRSYNPESHLNDYINYLSFIESKLLNVLKNKKFVNSRVIISGDHGLRGEDNIDQYKTSLFLKGYNMKVLDKDLTVQDLGYLINESF